MDGMSCPRSLTNVWENLICVQLLISWFPSQWLFATLTFSSWGQSYKMILLNYSSLLPAFQLSCFQHWRSNRMDWMRSCDLVNPSFCLFKPKSIPFSLRITPKCANCSCYEEIEGPPLGSQNLTAKAWSRGNDSWHQWEDLGSVLINSEWMACNCWSLIPLGLYQ